MILAGSCGINEVKVLRPINGRYEASTLIHDLKHGCFSVDSSYKNNNFVFSTAHQGMYIYSENK